MSLPTQATDRVAWSGARRPPSPVSSRSVAVDPAGFCKLKFLIQSSDGRTVYPGMEAFLTGTPSKAQLDDHAADIASAWSGGFAGYMSDHRSEEHTSELQSLA